MPETFGPEKADILIVGWGSSRGVIDEVVLKLNKEDIGIRLHLKIVYPIPLGLNEYFKAFKRVLTVEMAYGDSLKNSFCNDVKIKTYVT